VRRKMLAKYKASIQYYEKKLISIRKNAAEREGVGSGRDRGRMNTGRARRESPPHPMRSS
jgi:hypothetical protein